jgi:hypothetical protein
MAYVAASAVSGMVVARISENLIPAGSQPLRYHITGTYTAADFYLDASNGISFVPGKVEVFNMTDGTSGLWWLANGVKSKTVGGTTTTTGAAFVKSGWTAVAAGDKTVVAVASAGVSWAEGKLNFDVSACAPITDNDEIVIEITR